MSRLEMPPMERAAPPPEARPKITKCRAGLKAIMEPSPSRSLKGWKPSVSGRECTLGTLASAATII